MLWEARKLEGQNDRIFLWIVIAHVRQMKGFEGNDSNVIEWKEVKRTCVKTASNYRGELCHIWSKEEQLTIKSSCCKNSYDKEEHTTSVKMVVRAILTKRNY